MIRYRCPACGRLAAGPNLQPEPGHFLLCPACFGISRVEQKGWPHIRKARPSDNGAMPYDLVRVRQQMLARHKAAAKVTADFDLDADGGIALPKPGRCPWDRAPEPPVQGLDCSGRAPPRAIRPARRARCACGQAVWVSVRTSPIAQVVCQRCAPPPPPAPPVQVEDVSEEELPVAAGLPAR